MNSQNSFGLHLQSANDALEVPVFSVNVLYVRVEISFA